MGIEIEKKFFLKFVPEAVNRSLGGSPKYIEQGYLPTVGGDVAVRVRSVTELDKTRGFITMKGPGHVTRAELETEIPGFIADQLLLLCKLRFKKERFQIGRWELDYFPDLGLWIAEIELSSEDEQFEKPEWLGDEVQAGNVFGSNLTIARLILDRKGG